MLSSVAREKYEGMVVQTKHFGECVVESYHNRDFVMVRFSDGTLVKSTVSQICGGRVKNPMMPFVKGVGFVGQGIYSNKNSPDAHKKWTAMLERCYCPKYQLKKPTYIGCTVSDSWLNFQNFAKWFYRQPRKTGWHLDKDILVKGNKVYSEEFCCIVPKEINMLTLEGVDKGEFKRLALHHQNEIPENVFKALMGW